MEQPRSSLVSLPKGWKGAVGVLKFTDPTGEVGRTLPYSEWCDNLGSWVLLEDGGTGVRAAKLTELVAKVILPPGTPGPRSRNEEEVMVRCLRSQLGHAPVRFRFFGSYNKEAWRTLAIYGEVDASGSYWCCGQGLPPKRVKLRIDNGEGEGEPMWREMVMLRRPVMQKRGHQLSLQQPQQRTGNTQLVGREQHQRMVESLMREMRALMGVTQDLQRRLEGQQQLLQKLLATPVIGGYGASAVEEGGGGG